MSFPLERLRIVFVSFLPACSGSAVGRIISASPEIHWDRELQRIEPLDIRSPHDWHRGALGTCHFAQPLGILPYDAAAFASRRTFLDRLALDEQAEHGAIRALAAPRPLVQTTHVDPATIRRVFADAPIVAVVDSDPLGFTLRAYHEKFNRWLAPIAVQKSLWEGTPLDEAIARARAAGQDVELHDGRLPTGVQRLARSMAPTDGQVREVYRALYARMREQNRDLARSPATTVVDRRELFDEGRFRPAYGALCAALALSPREGDVERFIRAYNAAQWRRPRPDAAP